MLLLRRQGHSILQRWQYTISRNRAVYSSNTFCDGGIDIFTAAIRPLSLHSTSTFQNYNDAPSLQLVITRSNLIQSHIHPRHHQCYISNSFIHNCNNANNQLRCWFGSSGYGTHQGGRDRGNDRGRGRQYTNRIPMMNEFNTIDDAIEVYYNNLEIVTPRNLSSFWSAVPRLLKYQQRGEHLVPQLEAIFHKTADQIHSYGPKDLATTTLGFAKISQTLQRNKRGYVSGSYEEYLNGILIRQKDEVFDFIARTAVPILHQFNARDLKDLAYTYALLEYLPTQLDDGSTLFDHIADKSIPLLGKFNSQHISNTVWAFEKVKSPHPKLFKKVGDHIATLNHLNDFTPQALSNIVLAYAKAEVSHPDLFTRIGDHIVILDQLNNFDSQALANIIWSYAKAEVAHPELFERIGDHIVGMKHLNSFKPQELSSLLIAYAKAEASHPDLFYKVADHIVTLNHLNDFNPQELANIVYSYAKAQKPHPDLFNKVADYIVSLDNLVGYNEQEISNLVWAYHKAGIIRQDLYDKLMGVAMDRKFSMKRLETLKRWASEESVQNIEDDAQDEDENDGVVEVEDDNNENNIEGEDGKIEDDDPDASSEDLSLLTVVQLKDWLQDIGLPVSGRKQELIDRLNDHIQSK